MRLMMPTRGWSAALMLGLGLSICAPPAVADRQPRGPQPPIAAGGDTAPVAPLPTGWPVIVPLGAAKGVLIRGRFLAPGDSVRFGWLPGPEVLTLNGLEVRSFRQEGPPGKTPRERWLRDFRRIFQAEQAESQEERALRSLRKTQSAWADSARRGPPGSVLPSPLDTTYAPHAEGRLLRVKFKDQNYPEYMDLTDPGPPSSEKLAAVWVENFRKLMGAPDATPVVWLRGNFDYRYVPGETALEIIDLLRTASRAPLSGGDRRRALRLKIDPRDLDALDSLRVAAGGRK